MGTIIIKSPLTSNGTDVLIGPDGKIQYREDYADARSRGDFEKQNLKLPTNLKKIIEDVPEVPGDPMPGEVKEKAAEEPQPKTIIKQKVK